MIPKPFWAEVENTIKMPSIVKHKTDKSLDKIKGNGAENVVGGFLNSLNLI